MHTVIESECTGCDLCVEPCPVDCIDMIVIEPDIRSWTWAPPVVLDKAPNEVPSATDARVIATDSQAETREASLL
jgi:electron transport complex protein RnfB